MRLLITRLIWLAACLPALAQACWEDAGRRFGFAPELLYAIAQVESSLDPRAVNRSHIGRTGSYGIGLMQVESSNLPGLKKYGITEASLYDPCTNIRTGALILSEKVARHGMTWEAVGAYNASCTVLKGQACRAARSRYAWKVYRALAARQGQPAPVLARSVQPNAPLSARAEPAPMLMQETLL